MDKLYFPVFYWFFQLERTRYPSESHRVPFSQDGKCRPSQTQEGNAPLLTVSSNAFFLPRQNFPDRTGFEDLPVSNTWLVAL